MKSTALNILLIAVLCLALLSACARSVQNGRSHGSRTGIRQASNTDVYTFDLSEMASQFTLNLSLNATQGSYTWKVSDPNGRAAWQGNIETPHGTIRQLR